MWSQVTSIVAAIKEQGNKSLMQWIISSKSHLGRLCHFSFLMFKQTSTANDSPAWINAHTHMHAHTVCFNLQYLTVAWGNPVSVFSDTATVSASLDSFVSWLRQHCSFLRWWVRCCAEVLMEQKNNVDVVLGLPDQCEIIHGLMHDQTRGTPV